jgi:hypothetical protein
MRCSSRLVWLLVVASTAGCLYPKLNMGSEDPDAAARGSGGAGGKGGTGGTTLDRDAAAGGGGGTSRTTSTPGATGGSGAGGTAGDAPSVPPDGAAVPDARADGASADRPADAGAGSDVTFTSPDAPWLPDGPSGTAYEVPLPDAAGATPLFVGCGVPSSSRRYFCDDFEEGLAKWAVSGQDWGISKARARSAQQSATDSPDRGIQSGENAAMTLASSVDLTAAVAPILVFWESRAAADSDTYVEASADGGTTWTQLVSWLYASNDHSTWLMQQASLAGFVGKRAMIRFRLAQNGSSLASDGWYIDDVEIRETWPVDATQAAAAGCASMPAATSTRYFCDDFETNLAKWIVSGLDWNTTTAGARSGAKSITDTPDGFIVTGENVAMTTAMQIDLTRATAPILAFWEKRAAGDSDAYVEASADGGTTWTQLASWLYASNDHSTWLMQQVSLAGFVGKRAMIRFHLVQNGSSPASDGWTIDDVEVREAWPVDATQAAATGCDAMPAATSTRYFCDDFETNLAKWIASGFDWGTSTATARSGTKSATDTPAGFIVAGENVTMTTAVQVDLTRATAPILAFWEKRAAGDSDAYVEGSSDGGNTWTQLATWLYASNDHSTWLMQQVSLAGFVGKRALVRFRLVQNGSSPASDGWAIDDVEIRESWPADATQAAATGCDAMPAATSTRYFCDDFEATLAKWIASGFDWGTSTAAARSGTKSATDTPAGFIVAGENVAMTTAVQIDLTRATAPILTFWEERAAGDSDAYVEASADGGTTWTQLAAWLYASNDHSTWLMQQASLASFVGKRAMVRFRLAQNGSSPADGWYIDDVEVRETN